MFEIGFTELLIVGVVALIVLGPERLPRAARMLGLALRRARAHWHSVKAELERELAADELRRSLHEAREAGDELRRELRDTADAAARGIDPGFDAGERAAPSAPADPGAGSVTASDAERADDAAPPARPDHRR
jgi:sec-independent protein translocase protein TatB